MLAIVPELITVRVLPWPTDTALPPFCPEMMPPCRLVTVPPESNATTSPPNAAVWVMVPALVTVPVPGLPNVPMVMALSPAEIVAPARLSMLPPFASVIALLPEIAGDRGKVGDGRSRDGEGNRICERG